MNIFAGVISGILGSMGLGGGGVLIIYLTLFTDTPQDTAQGINLLFFLPCAIVAIIVYSRKKLIVWKVAIPFAILGVVGSIIGSEISKHIDNNILTKLFGALLIIMAIKTFFSKIKVTNNTDKSKN